LGQPVSASATQGGSRKTGARARLATVAPRAKPLHCPCQNRNPELNLGPEAAAPSLRQLLWPQTRAPWRDSPNPGQVCALLGAALPELVSQLVAPSPSARGADAGAGPGPLPATATTSGGGPAPSSGGPTPSGDGGPAAAAQDSGPGVQAAGGVQSGAAAGQSGQAANGSAAAAAARPAAPGEGAGAEGPLQRLLLECMSVGLVSDGASVDALLR
jgi:hypothetical protein